jgi:hypothetical protein
MLLALVAGSVHLAYSYVQMRMLDIGELQTERRHVALDGARQVEAELVIGVGDLTLEGGATDLMEAEFQYYTPPLYTTMAYTVAGEHGTLFFAHANPDVVPNFERSPEFQSKALVKLNSDVPLTLTVGLGLNEGRLRLADLNLNQLEIGLSVGDAEIDLRDDWQHPFGVRIEGGFGDALVYLPAHSGVRVQLADADANVVMRGLTQTGAFYVNDAFDKTAMTISMTVETGAGQVRLAVDP